MSIDRPKRWPVCYPVQLISEEFYEEGMMLNASSRGLAIATSHPLSPGTHIYVSVVVPGGVAGIDFQVCRVHWCEQGRIGLEVIGMDPRGEERWRNLLLSGKACSSLDNSMAPAVLWHTEIEHTLVGSLTDLVSVGWSLLTERRVLTQPMSK